MSPNITQIIGDIFGTSEIRSSYIGHGPYHKPHYVYTLHVCRVAKTAHKHASDCISTV